MEGMGGGAVYNLSFGLSKRALAGRGAYLNLRRLLIRVF